MNVHVILSELVSQLEKGWRKYIQRILEGEDRERDTEERIRVYFLVIKKEINKIKSASKIESDIEKQRLIGKKYDEKISALNNLLSMGMKELKSNHNLFKLSSTSRSVNQSLFQPRDLINFTLRINASYAFPADFKGVLPSAYCDPYPSEERELKHTFLKFTTEESNRLKMPLMRPETVLVKKGTLLEVKYIDQSQVDVFFRYTLNSDLIPSYFQGELYDANNPPSIDNDLLVKVCACKYGFMDSKIRTAAYKVNEDDVNNIFDRKNAVFNRQAIRPDINILDEGEIRFLNVDDVDDNSSAHYTPGSAYPISLHKRESHYIDPDDGL